MTNLRIVATNPNTRNVQETLDEFFARLDRNRLKRIAECTDPDEKERLQQAHECAVAVDIAIKIMAGPKEAIA